ncbi:MAG: acyl transferase [Flavobacteriales bacterium]|nr:acyl transferase [Flavobacteriales bacterium]
MEDLNSDQLFTIASSSHFNDTALELFRFQAEKCSVYRNYVKALGIQASAISEVEKIPFLPIEFFKSHDVILEASKAEIIFTSSGTSGQTPSRHLVSDISLYRKSFTKGFEYFYGSAEDYCILALLPSYMDREGSSLIMMAKELMELSGHQENEFYLNDFDALVKVLKKLKKNGQKTLLIGVTFGLLDLLEKHQFEFPELIVMETGGMKGRREELTRKEVHAIIKKGSGIDNVHSEYGMTELLSQAYSTGDGIFNCPPWMKVLARDINDPFAYTTTGKTGGLNIIDLANLNSCAFIATQDLGRVFENGSFEVLGRYDNSDVRGCNLMVV